MDASSYRWVNDLADRTAWAHTVVRGYAVYGLALFAALLLAGWWRARRADDPARAIGAVVAAGVAPLIALGAAQLVNHLANRPRPYVAMPSAHLLVARTTDTSFPSDHATVAGAVAAGLLLAGVALGSRRIGVAAAVAAVVMAAARVYVGAHYPGDVLAGLALGGCVALAASPLATPAAAIARWLQRTPGRWLVTDRSTRSIDVDPRTGTSGRRVGRGAPAS